MTELREKAREALRRRDWEATSALWKRLSEEERLALIRVRPVDKVPNEGNGWQQTGHRPHEAIGFRSEDNAGILTGDPSGVIVLDVDDEAAFTRACMENDWTVPDTFTVKTGKGFHHYYKLPQDSRESGDSRDYRNRAKKQEGWDIRANGGYIVAPGSVHPSGAVYEVIKDLPFNEAPEWLLVKAQGNGEAPRVSRKSPGGIASSKVTGRQTSRRPEVDIDNLPVSDFVKALIVEGAEEGARSEAVFTVITSLLEDGCDHDEIVALFMRYPIGEKAREKEDPEGWVYADIERIEAKMKLSARATGCDRVPVHNNLVVIPGVDELRVEYKALVNYAHSDLLKTIKGYGNVTSKSQEGALYTLLTIFSAMADGKINGRIAAPLPTGIGKTTSISAFLGRAYSMGMLEKHKGNFTVAVAASKVEQLCDLHEALVKAGVPENYISLKHSYRYNPEVQRDADGQLPVGYAALPASPPDTDRPILLLSHNKVKNGPEHAFDDSLKRRTFVIWDEAMISTDSKSMDVKRVAHGLNVFEYGVNQLNKDVHVSRDEATKLEVANSTLEFLKVVNEHILEEIASQEAGRPKQVVKFPHANETTLTEMMMALQWVAQAQEVEEVKSLILYLKALLRVTEYDTSVHLGTRASSSGSKATGGSSAVVRFDVVVPDSMKNMVILDASARINTLMMLDETVHLPANLPDLHLSYEGTVFHRIAHPAGRAATEEELKTEERHLLPGVFEIIQRHPDESILLFTFKHRDGKLHHREKIERFLTEQGIDIHEQLNGKPRFNWLTHGNETASNKYTHCSVAIFTGLMGIPRHPASDSTRSRPVNLRDPGHPFQ